MSKSPEILDSFAPPGCFMSSATPYYTAWDKLGVHVPEGASLGWAFANLALSTPEAQERLAAEKELDDFLNA